MMKGKLSVILRWVVLIVVLIAIYLPLALIVIYSFSSARDIGGEGEITFALYTALFEDESLLEAMSNTLIIGLSSAAISTFVGTFCSVGIHYMRKAKKAVNFISQITVVNAEIVTAIGFFLLSLFIRNVLNIPMTKGMGWLIMAHTVITIPYVILSVSPRLNQLNPNLFEASMDLGAGPMRSLFTVMFPQLVGSMISGFALAFTLSLDDFVITNLNTGSSGISTISTYVYENFKRNLNPAVRALSTIIFVAVLVILIIFNVISKKNAKKKN